MERIKICSPSIVQGEQNPGPDLNMLKNFLFLNRSELYPVILIY